jgi:hypothetical protein
LLAADIASRIANRAIPPSQKPSAVLQLPVGRPMLKLIWSGTYILEVSEAQRTTLLHLLTRYEDEVIPLYKSSKSALSIPFYYYKRAY